MRRGRPVTLRTLCLLAGLASPALNAAADPQPATAPASDTRPETRSEGRPTSALRLFANVEDAWTASDAERLASMVDTTAVRIAIKPGAPLAAALTRVAAAFLLHDQLRMVRTREFQMTRFQSDPKKKTCRATALWTGDWGGRQGVRAVRVAMIARLSKNGWLLTEIRAED